MIGTILLAVIALIVGATTGLQIAYKLLVWGEPHIAGRAPWGKPGDLFGGEPWTGRYPGKVKRTWRSW